MKDGERQLLNEELQNYIEQLIPQRDELLTSMEDFAKIHHIPIMELTGIETMLQILRIHRPKTILEVGTAIGYSALRMVSALPKSVVVTIERDEERYLAAEKFIEKSGKQNSIQLIKGDALEVEEQVKAFAPFDALFIDAAKGQYRRFFELYSPYLGDNGIIVTDNVLFKGLVCEPHIENRNTRSLVKKINNFNHWIMSHPQYDTTIIPVGDGVAISKKR
jgi:predicted O-methyltransferase YrrM